MIPSSLPFSLMAITPCAPTQRTNVGVLASMGVDPKAKRDLAMSYVPPFNTVPSSQSADADGAWLPGSVDPPQAMQANVGTNKPTSQKRAPAQQSFHVVESRASNWLSVSK